MAKRTARLGRFTSLMASVALAVSALCAVAVQSAASAEPEVSPLRADVPQSLLLRYLADNSAFTLIDARSPDEFASSHIAGAINIPYDAVDDGIDRLLPDSHAPIVIYCRTGKRAARLGMQLEERGYTNVRILRSDQIFWADGLAAFNCATPATQNAARVSTITLPEGSREENK